MTDLAAGLPQPRYRLVIFDNQHFGFRHFYHQHLLKARAVYILFIYHQYCYWSLEFTVRKTL